MSGSPETPLNFDKLFYRLINSEDGINILTDIKKTGTPEYFSVALNALTEHIEEWLEEPNGLSHKQWERVFLLYGELEKLVKPAKIDDDLDYPEAEGEDDDLPISSELVRLDLFNKQVTIDLELDHAVDEDVTVGSRQGSNITEESDDVSDITNPYLVNIEITDEIRHDIQEDIKETLRATQSMQGNSSEIKELLEPEKLEEILQSINSNPVKSLAELSVTLSQNKTSELRQLGNSLSEKWFYVLPTNTKGFGDSYEAKDNDFVKKGYHQLLHTGNQLLIELYGTKDIKEFIEKCKKMPLYQELLVKNPEYKKLYETINKKIPTVSKPPKNERQNLLTAIHCVMWSINHISSLQGTNMERGSFKIIDPDNRLYDMLTSYTKLVNEGQLPDARIVKVNPLSYTRQDTSLLGKHLSTHDPMCETLGYLYGIDSRPKGNSSLIPLLPEGRQHSIVGMSDIEGEYPTTTIKWELFGIGKTEDMWHHGQNLKEMRKLQAEGKLGKSTATGKSYRETEYPQHIKDAFIKFLETTITTNTSEANTSKDSKDPFVSLLKWHNKLKEIEDKETKETAKINEIAKKKIKEIFKKLSIHKIYDFMEGQIQSSEPLLKKEQLIGIKTQLDNFIKESGLDHPKIRSGSEIILDFSKFCLLKNNLQDLLAINKNPLLTITETVDSSKESAEGLSALYAELSKELSKELSSRSVQKENKENSEHLKKILREIFILENPDNYSVTSDTPHLHIAAQLRKINTHVAEKLLKRFPEIPLYNETTPLLLAASVGNNNMVQALLENLTICDELIDKTCPSKKTTPLDISLDNGHSYIIATLLQHGAKIGNIDNYNIKQKKYLLSELHKAERSQDDSIMERIRAKNPNIQDIITQLKQGQQTSLKTSIESSAQSPRSWLQNITQPFSSFRSKDSSNPQSPSSSPRASGGSRNQSPSSSPRRTGWWQLRSNVSQVDFSNSPTSIRRNALSEVEDPQSRSSTHDGLGDSITRIESEPIHKSTIPVLDVFANAFQRIGSMASPRKPKEQDPHFNSIEDMLQRSPDEHSSSSSPKDRGRRDRKL